MTVATAARAEQIGHDVERAIEETKAARAAARRIARDESLGPDRYAMLAGLAQKVRDEALVPEIAQDAIWAEASELLLTGKTPKGPAIVGDPFERACRALLRRGASTCPTCRRPLPDETALDRVRGLHEQRLADLLLRERAVEGGA